MPPVRLVEESSLCRRRLHLGCDRAPIDGSRLRERLAIAQDLHAVVDEDHSASGRGAHGLDHEAARERRPQLEQLARRGDVAEQPRGGHGERQALKERALQQLVLVVFSGVG